MVKDPFAPWKALSDAHAAAERALTSALRPHGLTPAQFELLSVLEDMRCGCCGEGECKCDSSYLCQNDVGSRIDCTKGNVSGIVQRLVQSGAISREPNPADRRYNAVRITAKGRTALFAARPAVEATLRAAFGGLSDIELDTLSRLSRRVGAPTDTAKGR